jgi:hypothetical protein
MAINKEDIKPGWYWVGFSGFRIVVEVRRNEQYGFLYSVSDYADDASDHKMMERYDFIARIEPPEGM